MDKVGFITFSYEGYGGTQVYARALTDSLSAAGIDVKLLDLSVLMRGVKGLRFPNYIFAPRFVKNLKTHLGDREIVHANNVTPNIAHLLLRFKRIQGIPLVFTAHELEYLGRTTRRSLPQHASAHLPINVASQISDKNDDVSPKPTAPQLLGRRIPAALVDSLRDPLADWSYARFLRGASLIISPTRWFATLLRDVVGMMTPVIHMYSPMSSSTRDFLRPSREQGRRASGQVSHSRADYVVFVGKLVKEKGAFLLPRLAHTLQEGLSLRVIGTGPLTSQISESQEEKIVRLGPVSEREKLRTIQESLVLVFPSVYPEPGPATMLEAFALGRPVVAFDIGGQAELVRESGCGLLAKPFDLQDFVRKVKDLVGDSRRAERMGMKGRDFIASKCEPDRYTRELMRHYQTASR